MKDGLNQMARQPLKFPAKDILFAYKNQRMDAQTNKVYLEMRAT
jgi:hypothetical protein